MRNPLGQLPPLSRPLAGSLMRTGGFYARPLHTARSTGAMTANLLEAIPIFIRRPITIDKLAIQTTGAATAGGVVRFGIYANQAATDAPGGLLYASSTVAVDSGTGTREATSVAMHLDPGLWWLAVVAQTAAPTIRQITGSPLTIPDTGLATTFASEGFGYQQTSVSGALPDPYGTPSAAGSTPPLIFFYIA